MALTKNRFRGDIHNVQLPATDVFLHTFPDCHLKDASQVDAPALPDDLYPDCNCCPILQAPDMPCDTSLHTFDILSHLPVSVKYALSLSCVP